MVKKLSFVFVALLVPVFCLAQNQSASKQEESSMFPPSMGGGKCPYLQEKGEKGMENPHRGMMGKMGKGMCQMGEGNMAGMMGCGMMGCGSAIAPSDKGGVIVLSGNRLFKYDRDLNLVKQVEIGTEQ